MGSRRSGATGGGRSCACGPGPRSRRWSWNTRRWRHRASRNRNTRAHPSAGCALPFIGRGWGAGCGHGRWRRAADRAGAQNAASAGVRSCGRTATSTARPGSREAWQALPPEPRHGTPASSLPASEARTSARNRAFFSRSDTIMSVARTVAARTSFFRRAFSSRSDAIVCSGFRERRGAGPDRASDDGAALRSRATSMRRDTIVLRLPGSTPASERSVSSRPTSACKESAFLAVRRTSRVSSTAAFSLFRLASSRHVSEPARQRDPIFARRSSSQRASAAAARARSRSYSDRTLRGAHPGAASQGDRIPSSPSASVSAAPKSASRIAIRPTISQGRNRHQPLARSLCKGITNVVPSITRPTNRYVRTGLASSNPYQHYRNTATASRHKRVDLVLIL